MTIMLNEFHRNVSAPNDQVVRRLSNRGFTSDNWLSFFPLPNVARIERFDESFCFNDNGRLAMIFVEYHHDEPVDLFAWDFADTVLSRTGWSFAMNGDCIEYATQIEEPIPVFRSVENLIKANCEGIFITDLNRAKLHLSGACLVAEDLAHAIQIRENVLKPACSCQILVETA